MGQAVSVHSRAVKGLFAGHAFSPAVDPVAVDGEQQNAAAVDAAEARLEEVDQRHLNFAESDGFNFHRSKSIHSPKSAETRLGP